MFTRLFRNSLSFEQLVERADNWIAAADRIDASDRREVIQTLKSNNEWLEAWRESHYGILQDIASVTSKKAQMIALREETIDQIEMAAHTGAVLAGHHGGEDRQILRDRLFPHRSVDEALGECYRGYVFATVHIQSLRAISRELGDAREQDWLAYLTDLHEQLAAHAIGMMIAESKDVAYAHAPVVPALQRMTDEATKAALAGENWQYDGKEIAREPSTQPPPADAVEPTRQPGITSDQLNALSDLLTRRMNRIGGGELYRHEEHGPSVPEHVFTVDTALMLIAMDDCVVDTDIAVHGLRHVISIAMEGFRPNTLPAGDVNLDVQMEFLTMWRENTKEPPLPRFCFAAAHLLYDIDPAEAGQGNDQTAKAIAASLVEDAWSVLASTKDIFGYRLEPGLIG